MLISLSITLTVLLAVRKLNANANVWAAYAESLKIEQDNYDGVLIREIG